MEQKARAIIQEDGHYFLEQVIDKFSPELLQAIVDGRVPLAWFIQIAERVNELKRGHLCCGPSDNSPGTIHWFEGDGELFDVVFVNCLLYFFL